MFNKCLHMFIYGSKPKRCETGLENSVHMHKTDGCCWPARELLMAYPCLMSQSNLQTAINVTVAMAFDNEVNMDDRYSWHPRFSKV